MASGLSYQGARYYDPALGRFLSEDPAFLAVGNDRAIKEKTGLELDRYLSDPQGLNSYAYARNNPLLYVDPDGKWFVQFSLSGTALYLSGAVGVRIDPRGIDITRSVGVGLGLKGGLGGQISNGNLTHESGITISRSGSLAYGLGLEVSREGTAELSDPFGLGGGRDQSTGVAVIVGAGAAISQDRTYSNPLWVWSEDNSKQPMSREATISGKNSPPAQSPSSNSPTTQTPSPQCMPGSVMYNQTMATPNPQKKDALRR